MDDVNEKLNALLSDPGSMAQIMQLAQQLSGSMGGDTAQPAAPTGADPRHQPNHPTSLRPAAVSEGRQTE